MPELGGPDVPVPEPVAKWRELERDFRSLTWIGRESELRSEDHGTLPVLLTAPHGGYQLRRHWPKTADRGTGGLALILARLTGCAAVASIGLQHDDPNFDAAIGPFKAEAMRRLPGRSIALDIHGMRLSRHEDICIGTGLYPDAATIALAQRTAARARAAGFVATVNVPFAADKAGTMTSFMQRQGRRALQIEINSRYLDPLAAPDRASQVVEFLRDVIEDAARLDQAQAS